MSNVLSEEKKQVIALGRLGWSLRRIERAAHLRRETAAAYLRAAGMSVRPPGGWERNGVKPAVEVSTDSEAEMPPQPPGRAPSASVCEPYREVIEADLARSQRDGHLAGLGGATAGFAGRYASVKRFVRRYCGSSAPEARVVIETAPAKRLRWTMVPAPWCAIRRR